MLLEGVTSHCAAAKRIGISRNTVKKYREGKEYSRGAAAIPPDVVYFITACLDEGDLERVKSNDILYTESPSGRWKSAVLPVVSPQAGIWSTI